MLKAILLIVSVVPFVATVGLGVAAQTEKGQFFAHIYGIVAVMTFLVGVGTHSFAPAFLYDTYFAKAENKGKKMLLWIAPLFTVVVSLAIFMRWVVVV